MEISHETDRKMKHLDRIMDVLAVIVTFSIFVTVFAAMVASFIN